MKSEIRDITKQVLSDRPILIMIVGIIVTAALYCIYVGLSLSATDSQIATRYTAFGITHFYRQQWYYLFTFVGFGAIFGIAHAALVAKLHSLHMRSLAIAFGWLSVIMIGIIAIITHAILTDIAYLS